MIRGDNVVEQLVWLLLKIGVRHGDKVQPKYEKLPIVMLGARVSVEPKAARHWHTDCL